PRATRGVTDAAGGDAGGVLWAVYATAPPPATRPRIPAITRNRFRLGIMTTSFVVYASIVRKKHGPVSGRLATCPPSWRLCRAGRSPRPPAVRWPVAGPPPRPAPPSRSGASPAASAGRAGHGRLLPTQPPASRGPASA